MPVHFNHLLVFTYTDCKLKITISKKICILEQFVQDYTNVQKIFLINIFIGS